MSGLDKKLIALFGCMIVVLILVIGLTVSLFSDNSSAQTGLYYAPAETTAATLPDSGNQTVQTTVPSPAQSTVQNNNSTVQNNGTTVQNNVPETQKQNVVNVNGMSDSEILAMLTTAVNKTKAYGGNVTVRHSESFVADVTECTGGNLAVTAANAIVGMVLDPTDETLSFSGGSAVNAEGESVTILLPQKGQFSLTISGISNISASNEGENIRINVTLVPEQVEIYEIPAANASSIGYLDIGSLDISILEVTSSDINYTGSTISAVINPEGYISYAEYTIPMHVEASAKSGVINGSAVFDGKQTEIWSFNW